MCVRVCDEENLFNKVGAISEMDFKIFYSVVKRVKIYDLTHTLLMPARSNLI